MRRSRHWDVRDSPRDPVHRAPLVRVDSRVLREHRAHAGLLTRVPSTPVAGRCSGSIDPLPDACRSVSVWPGCRSRLGRRRGQSDGLHSSSWLRPSLGDRRAQPSGHVNRPVPALRRRRGLHRPAHDLRFSGRCTGRATRQGNVVWPRSGMVGTPALVARRRLVADPSGKGAAARRTPRDVAGHHSRA
jgi:hypothetical protein